MKRRITVLLVLLSLLILTPGLQNDTDIFGNETNTSSVTPSTEMYTGLLNSIDPEELGVDQVRRSNTNITQVGTEAVLTTNTTEESLREGLKELGSGSGRDKIIEGLHGLMNGTYEGEKVEVRVNVYEVTSVYENVDTMVYRSRKEVVVNAEEEYNNLWVVEVLDEEVAVNHSDLSFPGQKPVVLGENPMIMLWSIGHLDSGDSWNVTYYVKGIVVGDEGSKAFAFSSSDKIIRSDERGEKGGGEVIEQDDTFLEEQLKTIGYAVSNNLIIFSVVIGVLLVLSIVAIELESRGAFEWFKDLVCDAEVCFRLGFKNHKIMDQYIKDCLEEGHHLEDIRISLMRAGWDRRCIRRLLEKYK